MAKYFFPNPHHTPQFFPARQFFHNLIIIFYQQYRCDYHNCKETHNLHDILYISYRFVHNPGNYLNLEIFDENIHPLHNKPLDSRSIHPKLLLNPITAISNKNAEFLLK